MAKFEIEKSLNGTFYYHLRATNNYEIVLRGTQYKTKNACHADIDAAKTNASNSTRYEKKRAVDGQYYFNLKNAAGSVVGTSEMYTTEAKRDHGIEVVKEQAPTAPVYDLT